MRLQTAQGIQRLTKNLAPFDLTKAEKLQIVNLTPVEPVELYVVCTTPPPAFPHFIPSPLVHFLSLADR
jgi:RNA polymerase Rpb4